MASDTNDTVVIAIQGNPVSDAVLDVSQDGYVLTWINADDQWEAKPATPQVSLQSQTFTSSGTWTCPANVYTVILDGCGGGGGGQAQLTAGTNYSSTSGGGGAVRSQGIIAVIPNTTYTITIGAGGAGGSGSAGAVGANGSNTTFDVLATFSGAGGATGNASGSISWGGGPVAGSAAPEQPNGVPAGPGYGGSSVNISNTSAAAGMSITGFAGGTAGITSGPAGYGGGGGGGGGFGAGPNGGDGNGSGAGNPGNNAPANSGAGGSGAGCGTSGNYDGGNGGSGQLIVAWIGIA